MRPRSSPEPCTIDGLDEYEHKPFIVTELMEGKSLSAKLVVCRNTLSLPTVPRNAIEIAGSRRPTQNGIIHRNIKPANIFLTNPGAVKILTSAWEICRNTRKIRSLRCER